MREEHNPLNGGELELEAALGRLVPRAPADGRDDIAYEAGRRAGRRAANPWRICSGALAACLLVSLYPRVAPPSTPPTPSPLATAPLPLAPPPRFVVREEPVRPAEGTYLAVRAEVLDKGVDALPMGGGGGGGSVRSVPRALDVRGGGVQVSNLFGVRS